MPTPALTQPHRDNGPIRISVPSREPSVVPTPHAQRVIPQKRTPDRREVVEQRSSTDVSWTDAPLTTIATPASVSVVLPEKTSNVSTRPTRPSKSTITEAPPPKRRKVTGKQKRTIVASQNTKTDPNVALQTIETGDGVVGEVAGEVARRGEVSTSAQLAKRKSTRMSVAEKRKQQIEEVAAPTSETVTAKAKKPRKNRGTIATASHQAADQQIEDTGQSIEEEANESIAGPTTKEPNKLAKAKGKKAIEDAAAAIVEDALQGSSKERKKRGRRSKRAETPDEAQHVRIDVAETKMSDLCRDGGTGQKSSADKAIRENERATVLKKKQLDVQRMMGQGEESSTRAGEVGESRIDRLDRERRHREERTGNIVPQQHIVNGEIVIDTSSLRIDRHAIAAVERDAEQLEYVEEDEYTRKINNGIGLKRDKSGGWNESLVDLFYDGLRMFGTDFGMISKMFPGKTRHAIKLKFCREEKENGLRIRAALLGEVLPVELEEFQKMTGEEYEDPSVLEKDIEDDKKKLEEEQEQEKQAIEAARRERAEQAEAERLAAQGEESSSKENRRQRKRKGGKGKKRKEKGEKGEKAPRRTKARKGGMLERIGENTTQQRAAET